MIIGFPGSPSFTSGSSYKPEIAVLAALLGGETSIKWAPGFSLLSKALDKAAETHSIAHISTTQHSYSDAGLLTVTLSGKGADVAFAGKVVVDTLKTVAAGNISAEDLKKATMLAKFRALEAGQSADTGIEASGMGLIGGGKAFQIDEVAKGIEAVGADKVKAVSHLFPSFLFYIRMALCDVWIDANPCCVQAAKALLDSKASISTVGDLYALPYAADIGLNVWV